MSEPDRYTDGCGLQAATPLQALFGRPYRLMAGALLVIEALAAVCTALSPLVQKGLIDGVNTGDRTRTIGSAVVLAVLLGLIMAGRTGSYLLRYRLGVEARCRIKATVFRRLIGMPESLLRDRGSGYFFNRLQSDSMAVVNFYSGNGLLQFADLLKFGFAGVVIGWLNWRCAVLLIPFLLIQYVVYSKYRRKQYRLGHRIQECTAAERYRMQEYLAGHTTLKTHNAAAEASRKLEQGFSRWRGLAFQRLFHENRFRIFLEMPLYVCCGAVGLYGLHQVLQQQWTLGALWALLLLIRQVFAPTQRLAMVRFQMQGVQASWERLRQLSAADGEAGDGGTCGRLTGDIHFDHVSFAYDPDQPLLTDLDLVIPEKSLFLLTGENGSGKSTLLLLLLRLFSPQQGEITIGGRAIRQWMAESYRARIGYLGQTPEFFNGTIRDNLLLGTAHSDDAIMAVLKRLASDGIVANRPQGLDARVQERGSNLSGGEKVRLALARELLRDTDILLLDEPAASLDYDARQQFYALLPQLQGERTVIAVIHDRPESLAASPGLKMVRAVPMEMSEEPL